MADLSPEALLEQVRADLESQRHQCISLDEEVVRLELELEEKDRTYKDLQAIRNVALITFMYAPTQVLL